MGVVVAYLLVGEGLVTRHPEKLAWGFFFHRRFPGIRFRFRSRSSSCQTKGLLIRIKCYTNDRHRFQQLLVSPKSAQAMRRCTSGLI